jgi:hypothetical protein
MLYLLFGQLPCEGNHFFPEGNKDDAFSLKYYFSRSLRSEKNGE